MAEPPWSHAVLNAPPSLPRPRRGGSGEGAYCHGPRDVHQGADPVGEAAQREPSVDAV